MSTTLSKRRRVRKACTPCHQRKRKCDNKLPCGMCTAYEYDCFYGADPAAARRRRVAANAHREPAAADAARERISPEQEAAQRRSAGRQATKTPALPKNPRAQHNSEPSTAAAAADRGIFDEYKSRYAGASAAMAFPHVLGVAFGSHSPPKMRSFAYNFGLRPDEGSAAAAHGHGSLARLITKDELADLSSVFFSVMSPIADLIEESAYSQRCRDYFHDAAGGRNAVAFGAVAAGVAALGSFLSSSRHPRESDLVQYSKSILDDPSATRTLSVDHIIAYGFRIFYLRATARPNHAWIASCTVLHLCEAVGLHRDENIVKMASMPGAKALGHTEDQLRRLFWVAYSGHMIMAYEHDRSPVTFNIVTCKGVAPRAGSVADRFVQLGQIIPGPNSPFQLGHEPSMPADELCGRLKALHALEFEHPFLTLTKADLAFCFYRRLYQLKTGVPDEISELIVNSGNAAIVASEQLASQGRMFWNVIGSVFQYTCVLLAMDTPASNLHVAKAFERLSSLVHAADTGLTREALSMARHLLSLSTAKKRRELAQLEAVEASYKDSPPQLGPQADEAGWEMDWDQFFVEPYLTLFGLDATL